MFLMLSSSSRVGVQQDKAPARHIHPVRHSPNQAHDWFSASLGLTFWVQSDLKGLLSPALWFVRHDSWLAERLPLLRFLFWKVLRTIHMYFLNLNFFASQVCAKHYRRVGLLPKHVGNYDFKNIMNQTKDPTGAIQNFSSICGSCHSCQQSR